LGIFVQQALINKILSLHSVEIGSGHKLLVRVRKEFDASFLATLCFQDLLPAKLSFQKVSPLLIWVSKVGYNAVTLCFQPRPFYELSYKKTANHWRSFCWILQILPSPTNDFTG
jgi:hypothetical protein